MNTYKFKTNAKCSGCTAKIDSVLKKEAAAESWSYNLADPNRTLTITTSLTPEDIVKMVAEAGYMAEQIL